MCWRHYLFFGGNLFYRHHVYVLAVSSDSAHLAQPVRSRHFAHPAWLISLFSEGRKNIALALGFVPDVVRQNKGWRKEVYRQQLLMNVNMVRELGPIRLGLQINHSIVLGQIHVTVQLL